MDLSNPAFPVFFYLCKIIYFTFTGGKGEVDLSKDCFFQKAKMKIL